MAALEIPGQPKRWGNESTNFYQASYTLSPGIASRDKVNWCPGSQYANSGHYHLGTKALNLYASSLTPVYSVDVKSLFVQESTVG